MNGKYKKKYRQQIDNSIWSKCNTILEPNTELILKETKLRRSNLTTYVVKRAGKIDTLIEGIHEDYQIEFNELLLTTGNLIKQLDPDLEIVQVHSINFERFLR